MAITVRPATHGDLSWVLRELKAFADFYGSKYPLFPDIEWAQHGMKTMIDNHCVLVAEKDGATLTGLIAGILGPHLFNPKVNVLTETFWWVPPEHRRSRAGLMLLNAFVKWAEGKAQWILFVLEDHSPVREESLIKRGFRLQERSYLKEA